VASEKVSLSGRRTLSLISLNIRTSLAIIGGAISGHRGEVPAARPVAGLCGLLGDSDKLLF